MGIKYESVVPWGRTFEEYVNEVINKYTEMGYCVNEVIVDYEFQKGGNTMLKIAHKK